MSVIGHHQPGPEDPADLDLSAQHGAQLRRNPPRDRQSPDHRRRAGRDPGQLGARGRRHYSAEPFRRSGEGQVPTGLERLETLSAGRDLEVLNRQTMSQQPARFDTAGQVGDPVAAMNLLIMYSRQRQDCGPIKES